MGAYASPAVPTDARTSVKQECSSSTPVKVEAPNLAPSAVKTPRRASDGDGGVSVKALTPETPTPDDGGLSVKELTATKKEASKRGLKRTLPMGM